MHERKPWTQQVLLAMTQEDDLIKQSVLENADFKWRKILTWIKDSYKNSWCKKQYKSKQITEAFHNYKISRGCKRKSRKKM